MRIESAAELLLAFLRRGPLTEAIGALEYDLEGTTSDSSNRVSGKPGAIQSAGVNAILKLRER